LADPCNLFSCVESGRYCTLWTPDCSDDVECTRDWCDPYASPPCQKEPDDSLCTWEWCCSTSGCYYCG
jgi:hypothetical protein